MIFKLPPSEIPRHWTSTLSLCTTGCGPSVPRATPSSNRARSSKLTTVFFARKTPLPRRRRRRNPLKQVPTTIRRPTLPPPFLLRSAAKFTITTTSPQRPRRPSACRPPNPSSTSLLPPRLRRAKIDPTLPSHPLRLRRRKRK